MNALPIDVREEAEYYELVLTLFGKDNLDGKWMAPMPITGMFDEQSFRQWPGGLGDRGEQSVAAEVCRRTKMEPATWGGMDVAARIPWLRQAVATQTGGAEPAAAADDGWPTQAEVARGFNTNKTKVQRWLECGKLRDNGKKGAARRVDPASIPQLCHSEGVTYNEK